ncbi:MAG: helix-turn-helix domain-containing protein [Pseudomonadota bacterium]
METEIALLQLSALAHEGRLDLFRRLVRAGEAGMPAGDLARAAGLNLTTSSAQLSVLATARLVARARDGRSIIYTADYARISGLLSFLMEDCCAGRPEILTPLADITTHAACCDPDERPTP